MFWDILGLFGTILGHYETFWDNLETIWGYFETFWDVLGRFCMFCDILVCVSDIFIRFGTLLDVFGHFGMF